MAAAFEGDDRIVQGLAQLLQLVMQVALAVWSQVAVGRVRKHLAGHSGLLEQAVGTAGKGSIEAEQLQGRGETGHDCWVME